MAVLEAKHYKEEKANLMLDPIIQMMAATLPNNVDFTSWDFICAASDEYHKRGGKNARSIGGPARAIKELKK